MKLTERKVIPMPDPFKSPGGSRLNAGRKSYNERPMNAGIYIRCTEEQKEALQIFVKELSEKQGINISVSAWLRELGLKHSGNENLCAEIFGDIV